MFFSPKKSFFFLQNRPMDDDDIKTKKIRARRKFSCLYTSRCLWNRPAPPYDAYIIISIFWHTQEENNCERVDIVSSVWCDHFLSPFLLFFF